MTRAHGHFCTASKPPDHPVIQLLFMTEGASNNDKSHAETSNSSAKLVEIKIKTLDSQVYSCNVDQNISVPALKDHIATLTGVPTENQRLICRGKVLKDDHTLREYNVEDGHTLHLVTRPQPGAAPSSAVANAGEEEQGADDPSSGASRNRLSQISHSVAFNVPDNGDGGLPDVNRIITSVLQSLGIGNIASNAGPTMAGPALNPALVAVAPAIGAQDAGPGGDRPTILLNQPPALDRGVGQATWPTAGPGILPGIAQQVRLLQQAMIVPDALTTIIQYLDGLEQALALNGSLAGQQTSPSDPAPPNSASTQPAGPPIVIRGSPTPVNLGAVIRRTMDLMHGQAGLELIRLSSQLENEPSLVDAGARGELQSATLRDGVLLQHLGALLLELGRATLTSRVGMSAMESAVNAGPAVFISTAGPNPMMVQPLPFQPGAGFGVPHAEIPRNVSIHIHANDAGAIPGFPAPVQGLVPGNTATQGPPATLPVGPGSGAANITGSGNITSSVHAIAVPVQVSGPSALNEQPGIRVVPMRTVIAALPANLQSRSLVDNTGVHPNILHPLLARFQQLNSHHRGILPIGTPAGSSIVPPPASAAQQVPNPAAPTIRAQLQVQAWVPDGEGGSRLVTNEEALRTLLNTTQVASLSTAQQPPPQNNATASQTNLTEETSNVPRDVHDSQPADPQQVSSDVHEDPGRAIAEVARGMQGQAEVGMNNSRLGVDENEMNNARAGSSQDVETKHKDTNKTSIPAGLGLGGLRPLPSRTPKRPGGQQQTSHIEGSLLQDAQNRDSPAHEQGGPVSTFEAECNAQGPSLFADSSRISPSQTSPLFQPPNNLSSRRGGGGNFDIGSLVAQFAANSGGMTPSTRARDQDQGMGLPAGALGNLLGQVMQNPFMRNVMRQVVEQVGEGTLDHEELAAQGESAQGANPQGGMDFSRLLQNMMPVVSQAINRVGGTTATEGTSALNGVESGLRQGSTGLLDMQSNGSNVPNGTNVSAISQQMMPVVAQAFGGALTGRPEQDFRMPNNSDSRTTEARNNSTQQEQRDEAGLGSRQPKPTSSEGPENLPVAKRQKIDLEKALEKLEQGSSPGEILRVLVETASMLMTPANNQEANASLLGQVLSEDDNVADDYMALLLSDLTSRREEDP
ncbi:hypothetical protein L7F22_049685 [Adiantum nelumboides]|nr:hypothetical protein [Adiantum nelumboides]